MYVVKQGTQVLLTTAHIWNFNKKWARFWFEGEDVIIENTWTGNKWKRHSRVIQDINGDIVGDKLEVRAYLSEFIGPGGSTDPEVPVDPSPPVLNLYVENDCLSEVDLDNIGRWTQGGALLLSVNSTDPAPHSEYCMEIHSYAPGGQDYVQLVFSGLTQGVPHEIHWQSKFIAGGLPGANAKMSTWLGVVASPNVDLTANINWTVHTAEFTPNQSQVYMRFWVNADSHDGTGDKLLIDTLRLNQI